jgi:hypothetical protein
MRKYRFAVLITAMSVGVVGSFLGARAGHLQSCATRDHGDYRVHEGTDSQNHCLGQDGPDSDYIYGLGSRDELGGQQGYDILKGATGDDELTDGQGTDAGDYDGTCHGAGNDYTNVQDKDGKDDIYMTGEPDGGNDTYTKNDWDLPHTVSGSCPIADPIGSPSNPGS